MFGVWCIDKPNDGCCRHINIRINWILLYQRVVLVKVSGLLRNPCCHLTNILVLWLLKLLISYALAHVNNSALVKNHSLEKGVHSKQCQWYPCAQRCLVPTILPTLEIRCYPINTASVKGVMQRVLDRGPPFKCRPQIHTLTPKDSISFKIEGAKPLLYTPSTPYKEYPSPLGTW